MIDFPSVSTENFTYSPAEHGAELSTEVEAHFCLNLKTLIKNINPYENVWYERRVTIIIRWQLVLFEAFSFSIVCHHCLQK